MSEGLRDLVLGVVSGVVIVAVAFGWLRGQLARQEARRRAENTRRAAQACENLTRENPDLWQQADIGTLRPGQAAVVVFDGQGQVHEIRKEPPDEEYIDG